MNRRKIGFSPEIKNVRVREKFPRKGNFRWDSEERKRESDSEKRVQGVAKTSGIGVDQDGETVAGR